MKDKPHDTRITLEAVAMRDKAGDITIEPEIYLRQLPVDDPNFPGLWAVPRALYRHGDTDGNVILRLESHFDTEIKSMESVGMKLRPLENETLFSKIFIVVLAEDPLVDDLHGWFSTDNLPKTVTEFHRTQIIPAAVAYYKSNALK